jgi:hypothetical protein
VWFPISGISVALAVWLTSRLSTRSVDYGIDGLSSARIVGAHGPFDAIQFWTALLAAGALLIVIMSLPGFLIRRIFSARLTKRLRPSIVRFGVVPIASLLFWVALALLLSLFTYGCASSHRYLVGSMNVPLSLYEGTSYPIHLLMNERFSKEGLTQALEYSKTQETIDLLLAIRDGMKVAAVQVELQAPEVAFGGEKKLVQKLQGGPLQFDWTLNFNVAGPKVLTFIFGFLDETGKVTTAGHIDHRVEVTKLGFLSKPQAAGLATGSAVVALLTSIVGLIKPLGQRFRRKKEKETVVQGFKPAADSSPEREQDPRA